MAVLAFPENCVIRTVRHSGGRALLSIAEKCVWDCRVGKMRHDLRVIRRGESPPMGRIWEGGRVGVHIHLMPTSKTLSCQWASWIHRWHAMLWLVALPSLPLAMCSVLLTQLFVGSWSAPGGPVFCWLLIRARWASVCWRRFSRIHIIR